MVQPIDRSNYRSREMGEALRTLERAMLLYLLYPSTSTGVPALPDKRKAPKLLFLDTGLINYFVGLQSHFFPTKICMAFTRASWPSILWGRN
jgi:predicted AAA+ superfamily ATPase